MANTAPLPRSAFAAYAGRNQGPEFFLNVPFVAGQQTVLSKPLSLNRPLEGLFFRWRGRVVISVAAITNLAPEAPQTIINRFRVLGTYKGTSLTPVDISGATAYAMFGRVNNIVGNSTYITNGGVTTRLPDLGVPIAIPTATFGNTGTYDIEVWYFIPTWPMVSEGSRALQVTPYLWQPQDWNDTITIQINFGDATSFGTGGATVAFTAFGSGAGSPSVDVFTRYQILGALRTGFRTACVIRNEVPASGVVSAIANQIRLYQLSKQKTTAVLLKTGINLTGVNAGISVFGSLSDDLLDNSQIMLDNRAVRNNISNRAAKESMNRQFGTISPQGYLQFSFIDSQSIRAAFRGDLQTVVGPGSQFEVDSNILTASANNLVNLVQEQIYADADDPYWAGTR